jgi:hypothetical protein
MLPTLSTPNVSATCSVSEIKANRPHIFFSFCEINCIYSGAPGFNRKERKERKGFPLYFVFFAFLAVNSYDRLPVCPTKTAVFCQHPTPYYAASADQNRQLAVFIRRRRNINTPLSYRQPAYSRINPGKYGKK